MSILIFRSGQLLSLVTAGAPEGGLSGGCQGAILSSRRLNVKKEIPIINNSGTESRASLPTTINRKFDPFAVLIVPPSSEYQLHQRQSFPELSRFPLSHGGRLL